MTSPGVRGAVAAGTTAPRWPTGPVRRLPDLLRGSLLVLHTVLAAVGALFVPVTSMVLGACLGLAGWGTCRLLHRHARADLPPLPRPAVAGVAVGALPAGLGGAVVLGPAAVTTLLVGWCLTAWLARRWLDAESDAEPAPVPALAPGSAGRRCP